MTVKKIFIMNILLLGSTLLSENKIFWDLGVIISNKENIQKINDEYKTSKINAIISDPFVPPKKNTNLQITTDKIKHQPIQINELPSLINKLFLSKKYQKITHILQNRDLTTLSKEQQYQLNYLLTYSFYKIGDYNSAKTSIYSLIKKKQEAKLYFLLAIINESLKENNNAIENYLKIISYYPNSEYVNSAKIKYKILAEY